MSIGPVGPELVIQLRSRTELVPAHQAIARRQRAGGKLHAPDLESHVVGGPASPAVRSRRRPGPVARAEVRSAGSRPRPPGPRARAGCRAPRSAGRADEHAHVAERPRVEGREHPEAAALPRAQHRACVSTICVAATTAAARPGVPPSSAPAVPGFTSARRPGNPTTPSGSGSSRTAKRPRWTCSLPAASR